MAMAPRPFWKGYLKLSLVTCPVAMTPAITEGQKVRFHTLNRETGNRIESRYIDPESDETVDEDNEIKAYQLGPDEYVMLEDEELDSVALDSTRTIDIDVFVPKDSIDWIWYERPHYLTPDDPVGEEAFSVIRDAMQATHMVGISRLVLYRRERAVMLEPRDRGIVLWTLRYGDEVRDPSIYFGELKSGKADSKLMPLVAALIDERIKEWDPAMVRDTVQERLLDIISSKKKGKPAPQAKELKERPSNVVNIMDALRKSIASDGKPKKRR
jgi:DNA end-binding protein Ku